MNLVRISRMVALSSLGIHCSKSIRSVRMVSSGIRSYMKKFKRVTGPIEMSLFYSMSQFTVIDVEDENEDEQGEYQSPTVDSVLESCNDFLSSTMNYLTIVFDAISDSAFQYKTALNELCSCLEKYETSKAFTITLEELEDAVIAARAKVYDCEKKYLKMTTVVKGVEKLAGAISELSFLLGEESLTLVLKSTLHSISESIIQDSVEIKRIKWKLNNFENMLFLGAESSTDASNDDEKNGDDSDINSEMKTNIEEPDT